MKISLALAALFAMTLVVYFRFPITFQNFATTAATDGGAAGDPSRFFLISTSGATGLADGDETFGDENSVGMPEGLANAYPALLPDIAFIGDDNQGREQFLSNSGYVFRIPDRKWQTTVELIGAHLNETRIKVDACVGHDALVNVSPGGPVIGMEVEVALSEIWRIDVNGGHPVLLERIKKGSYGGFDWFHHELNTTSEAPPSVDDNKL